MRQTSKPVGKTERKRDLGTWSWKTTQSYSILFFHNAGIAIMEPLKEPFLTQTFLFFQECNPNKSIFLNDTKLSCNVDVTQRGISSPKTSDIWFPAELSSAVWNCPHWSLCLLKNKRTWSFQISCRVHQAAMVSTSARKKLLHSAWVAHVTLAAHFYEMQSFFC